VPAHVQRGAGVGVPQPRLNGFHIDPAAISSEAQLSAVLASDGLLVAGRPTGCLANKRINGAMIYV
jgi:hypothetical protein